MEEEIKFLRPPSLATAGEGKEETKSLRLRCARVIKTVVKNCFFVETIANFIFLR